MSNWISNSCLVPFALCLLQTPALAQIIPDDTLPNNSVVTPQPNNLIEITGGTEVGDNLFHSFEEFSVFNNSTAHFNNALQIKTIFSRVTGDNISNIDGIIRANGTANLFFLNPNGIVFGPNARLEIGGSFLGTTAESINFADGTQFSATNPQAPPLLTVNVPLGLQFGATPQDITLEGEGHRLTADPSIGFAIIRGESQGLRVNAGQTLGLVGGNVILTGANLIAEEGRIELGSVGSNSTVSLDRTESGFILDYEGVQNFQDIQLGDRASVDASGKGGGDIQVQGRRVSVAEDSLILALTEGENPGGNLSVNASELVEVIATGEDLFTPSSLLTESTGSGTAGDLTISTGLLIVRNGAQLSSSAFSDGKGGNLSVTAFDLVEVSGTTVQRRPSSLQAVTEGLAEGGDLNITSDRTIVEKGAIVSTITIGDLPGGDLTINARELIVREEAQISTTTFGPGNAGNLQIRNSDFVEVSELGGLFTQVQPGATGNGGKLTIHTGELRVSDGGQISTGTAGEGQGGNLTITASESVEVTGGTTDGFLSSLLSQVNPGAMGSGGDLTIHTRKLIVRHGAGVSAGTTGMGNGGNLIVNASDSVELSGTGISDTGEVRPSGLFARSRQPAADAVTGNAGNLIITANRLTIEDGAIATASSILGSENAAAGTLRVNADEVRLDNGIMTAETNEGNFGNIELNSDDIQLRRNSQITTNAQTTTGGNIAINTDTLVALENSDITANAREGAGGRVTIETEGLFGTESRDATSLETSDITATSELGPQFSGIVEINRPEVDPIQGLVELDDRIVDVSNLIAQNLCRENQGSEFTITGRGGVASSPNELLSAGLFWEDKSDSSESSITESRKRLVEAQGWIVRADGKIELVANPPKVTPHAPWFGAPGCK